MIIPARLPLLIFAAALGGAWWRALPPPAPAFVVPPALVSHLPASFASSTLTDSTAHASAPSLTRLPDGRIAAAWQQIPEQREQDATIRLASWDGQQWLPPRIIVDRRLLANASKAQVQTLGRPTLFAQGPVLHLWLTAANAWHGSALYHLQSSDGGENWGTPQRLATSPLFNLGSRDSQSPLPLADGGLGLASSHALFAQHGEWLRFDAQGRLLNKSRLPQPEATREPQVLALDAQSALALMAASPSARPPLRAALTADGALRWASHDAQLPQTITAPTALIRLSSGNLLLAAQAQTGPASISLWLSHDQGSSWRQTRSLSVATPAALALIQDGDGRIHLALDGQPEGIRHLRFSEAWLLEAKP